TFIPGIAGALSLLMGFYSLSVLDAYWAGILLVFLSFGLFIAEIFTPTFGIFTAGGVISMIAGALILFSGGPSAFSVSVDWWVIAVVVIGVVAFFVFAIQAVVRTQRGRQPTGADGLTGMTAEVRTTLNPKGTVLIHGELWQAIIDEGQAEPGEEVIVKEVDGLKLKVSKKGE
ncbi:MAG: NfeD family protein, partial [Dehalococcoidia bacterium]